VLLDTDAAARGIRRMAGEIVERAGGAGSLGLVGIRRGGVPLAEKLAAYIEELEQTKLVAFLPFTSDQNVTITVHSDR